MSDMANSIMDIAERQIRVGGYGAFSFRDIAAEVGIKSASIHYHFPTKENLTVAVLKRYTARVSDYIDELYESERDPVKLMAKAFGDPVHSADRLCPCINLGAAIGDVPAEVSKEVAAYYRMWVVKMEALGLKRQKATTVMAALVGAQLLARVFDDVKAYDDAAEEVVREHSQLAA
ncbi:MAG: helix-turn-helix transcriptional regulator [Silvibacterium sp.]|nr:helix-turn-helix transcriptional regulator [Silvibacterium sp.]